MKKDGRKAQLMLSLYREFHLQERNLLDILNIKKHIKFKGFSKTVFIKTTYFEDDIVNNFLKVKACKLVQLLQF